MSDKQPLWCHIKLHLRMFNASGNTLPDFEKMCFCPTKPIGIQSYQMLNVVLTQGAIHTLWLSKIQSKTGTVVKSKNHSLLAFSTQQWQQRLHSDSNPMTENLLLMCLFTSSWEANFSDTNWCCGGLGWGLHSRALSAVTALSTRLAGPCVVSAGDLWPQICCSSMCLCVYVRHNPLLQQGAVFNWCFLTQGRSTGFPKVRVLAAFLFCVCELNIFEFGSFVIQNKLIKVVTLGSGKLGWTFSNFIDDWGFNG